MKPQKGYVKYLDGSVYRILISRDEYYNWEGTRIIRYDTVKNLNELESFSELDLLKRTGLGRKMLKHIQSVMESYGLKLGRKKVA